jgi:hypothetical protein
MPESRAARVLLAVWCAVAPLQVAVAADSGRLKILAVAPGYGGEAAVGARWTIYLDGFIDTGAADRMTRLVEQESIADALVYFNSPGGHLVEAMTLGRLLRKYGYEASVGTRATVADQVQAGVCYSACPFAYAGGVRRSIGSGSVLGVHRAENSVPVSDEAAFQTTVSGQASAYLAAMGVSGELLALMSDVPHDGIRILAPQEAARMNLVTTTQD